VREHPGLVWVAAFRDRAPACLPSFMLDDRGYDRAPHTVEAQVRLGWATDRRAQRR